MAVAVRKNRRLSLRGRRCREDKREEIDGMTDPGGFLTKYNEINRKFLAIPPGKEYNYSK